MKIDIEGSELGFLKSEYSFLKLCDSILVEWHKWAVQLDELRSFLESHGFDFIKVVEENDQMGTACFRRS